MKLFQMKANPRGIDRMALFLKDHFVCIGESGIGSLENIRSPELERRLIQASGMPDTDVTDQVNEICCFVQMMQDGDYVLVAHEQEVYLGDVGDYYYVEQHDNILEGMCHRRGVTWLNRIPRGELNTEVQALLNHKGVVTPYEQAMETAELNRWLPIHLRMAETAEATPSVPLHRTQRVGIDHELLEQALDVLKDAMNSDDPERRERAAIAILQYAAQTGSSL